MKNLLFSYDIIDTCLIRKCGRQDFLFEILANIVLEKSEESILFDFILARKKAEQDARIKSGKEDVNISEIYDCIDVSSYTEISPHSIMEMEIDLHEKMLVPSYEIKREIDTLHEEGNRIVFISDMYLSKSFFRKILQKYGFFLDGDEIYVSGDIGKTKCSGSLYDYVKEDLKIDFKQWIHKGDNIVSDNRVPRKLGIKTCVVKNTYSYYEGQMIKIDTSGSILDIQKASACSRAVRLSMSNTAQIFFASDFIAPLYTSFVMSILKDARKRKLRHLFFMARDGYILYLIAKELHSLFPDIDLTYFYASRTSIYLPGLNDLSVDSLAEAFPIMSENVEELLSILGLTKKCVDIDYNDQLDAKGKIDALLRNKDFYALLEDKYRQQSLLCIKYFEQIGLTKPYSAVVDVFGSRKCEMFINRILRRNGYSDIYGYYYGVMWSRILDDSRYNAMFYSERLKIGINGSHYTQKQSLFEQYFSITNHQRTVGYQLSNSEVIPIFEKDSLSNELKAKIFKTNSDVCMRYARYYSLLFIRNDRECCQAAQAVFNHFFHVPRREYLVALDGFSISDNGKLQPIFFRKSLISIIKRKANSNEWIHGLLIYNSSFLYKPLLFVLEWLWNRKNMKIISSF